MDLKDKQGICQWFHYRQYSDAEQAAALLHEAGVLNHIDIVAIRGFPGMWWPHAHNWDWFSHWRGWAHKMNSVSPTAGSRPIWIAETGLSTWAPARKKPGRYAMQLQRLTEAAEAPSARVYWYSLMDLRPELAAIEGFHTDENEYHLGLIAHDGTRKPAWRKFCKLLNHSAITDRLPSAEATAVMEAGG